jgi:two-component system, response regulator PdtaR
MTGSAASPAPLVLVVEEETHEREAIAEHLREAGYDVCDASTTDEALSGLEGSSAIRMVVTDAHVPGAIDGFELARVIRERWPEIGVVLTSGHSDPSSGPVPDGAAFVAKPYLFEHLSPTLARLARRPRP